MSALSVHDEQQLERVRTRALRTWPTSKRSIIDQYVDDVRHCVLAGTGLEPELLADASDADFIHDVMAAFRWQSGSAVTELEKRRRSFVPRSSYRLNVDVLYARAFAAPRNPRSQAYKDGVRAALAFRIVRKPIDLPYTLGTAEADAFFAGTDEGHHLWRTACAEERKS